MIGTASSAQRLLACPASAALSKAENHNEWAQAGHDDHERLAGWLDHRDNELISDIVAAPLLGRLAALCPDGARAETKFAYDVATRRARVIGYGSDRNYGELAGTEIAGSADVVAAVDGVAIVNDWKTGHADVEPAATNRQLWFLALAACRALQLRKAVVRIIYTKTGVVDECEIGPLELAQFAGELAALPGRIDALRAKHAAGELLDTREGSWCKHCPSKAVCPSKNALLVQFSSGGMAKLGDAAITPGRAADAYRVVFALDQLVKDARQRLQVYVDEHGPIDLGGGRMFGRYAKKGNEVLDGNVAVAAIREVIPPELVEKFEEIALDRSTSKAAIKRAADATIAKGAAKTAGAVIEKIRELGGASTKRDTLPIGEYAADRNAAAARPAIDVEAVDRLLESA